MPYLFDRSRELRGGAVDFTSGSHTAIVGALGSGDEIDTPHWATD